MSKKGSLFGKMSALNGRYLKGATRFLVVLIFSLSLTLIFFFSTFALQKQISSIYATSATSLTRNTDTQFNQGTASSTTVSGSGSAGKIQLSGSAGPDGTQYRKAITIDNSTNSSTLTDYQVLVDEGEVGYWKMDETTGATATDSSGLSNTGTATGTTIVDGRYGKARSFNGSGDFIDTGTNSITGSSPFTLSAWINTATVTKYSAAISIGTSASNQLAYIGTVANAQVGTTNSIGGGFHGSNYGSGITTTNTWVHVAMTYAGGSGGAVKMYINGIERVNTSATPNLGITNRRIGRLGTDTSYDFQGMIDEARVYNRALSANEVTSLYANNRSSLLDTVYSNTQESGADLRFKDSDDSTDLNYWIEKYTSAGQNAKLWVKVPSIPANSTKTIYLYYGSGSAIAGSNGDNTFDFFDDFTGSAIDSNKWNSSGAITVSNSVISMDRTTSDFIVYSKNAISSQSAFIAEAKYQHPSFSRNRLYLATSSGGGSPVGGDYGVFSPSTYWKGEWTGMVLSSNTWYTIKWINTGSNYIWKILTMGGSELLSRSQGSAVANAKYITFNGTESSTSDYSLDWFRSRKYSSPEPSVSAVSAEETPLSTSGTWSSPTDSNVYDLIWNGGWGDGTDGSTAFSATVASVTSNATITFKMRSASTAEGLSSATYYTLGAANTGTTFTRTKAQLDVLGIPTGASGRYIQVKAEFAQSDGNNPALDDFTIYYLADSDGPGTNASSISMKKTASGSTVSSQGWTNNLSPYFSWTAGVDSESNIKGYCLYLGTSSGGDPAGGAGSKGLLGTSPVSTTGSTCEFIVSGTNIDLATTAYRGSTWLTSSSSSYYLNIKAIDNVNNVYSGSSTQFEFKFDNTSPSNPAYLTLPSDFIATKEATLTWPTSGGNAPSDSNSNIAGLQYRIGSSGTWYGDSHTGTQDSTDLLTNDGIYTTDPTIDYPNITEGNNAIYLRVWDNAGNYTTSYITGALKVNITAPSIPQNLTVDPTDATTNSYSFSWAAPSTYQGSASNITYCYTVNTIPTSSTCNFTSAGVLSLSSDAYATQPGENTLYLVAKDEAGNINYDVYSSVTFTYSGTAPGIPRNIDIADISIKSTSSWKLAISWDSPSDIGAGINSYKIYRSTTDTTCSSSMPSFTLLGSTAGTSYSDTGLTQQTYYYCVKACDSANSCSAASSTISLYPDGKFTSSAGLTSGPTASGITTKTASITWSTDRTSDSKVQYGTTSGSYFAEEVSNSTQATSHSITLTNLSAGTTYYYKAKWTDEDGNTGLSDERTFTTDPKPVIIEAEESSIGIDYVYLQFTSRGASKVKVYYGPTTSFGGVKEISVSTSETKYTEQIEGLTDDTKYYYKINTFDVEGTEYEGDINSFTTLPLPKISLPTTREVKGASTPTVLLAWETNTEVSSIVTYYPKSDPGKSKDEIDLNLKNGAHTMFIRGLLANTDYIFIISGKDKIGTEARSEPIPYTTAVDTRAPQITDINTESSTSTSTTKNNNITAQLIISWTTDEPSTSQVEFGEGTGTTYSQKTQNDKSLTYNHHVIISGLTPSKVYHFRPISADKTGNIGMGIDNVAITPKAIDNALDLVITNLREVFGFLK